MAPLPVDSTARWFFDYQNSLHTHTLMIRGTTGATDSSIEADLATLMTDLSSLFCASTFTGARKAAAGSNLAFPYASGTIGDSFGSGAATPETNATAATFVGRSTDGRRSRFSIFGWTALLDQFRVTTAESSHVLDAVNHLNAFSASFASIGGLVAIWNGYCDIKANDHWVKDARS